MFIISASYLKNMQECCIIHVIHESLLIDKVILKINAV